MMYVKKSVCFVVLMVLSAGISAHAKNEDKHFVGAYALNFDEQFFGTMLINANGTFVCNDTTGIQLPLPPMAPAGWYATAALGAWKKICKNRIRFVSTFVINFKDIFSCDERGDLLLAGIQFARGRFEGDLELSECGNVVSGSGTLSLFEINDTTFTKRLINPYTGLPVPAFELNYSGNRLEFLSVAS